MPTNKDLKRLIRARMKKTGESYTAARAQLRGKDTGHAEADQAEFAAIDHAELAGMSDDAVRNATGKDWSEWVALLDAAGATGMAHRDIAALLSETHDVPDWWSQMVTVGYERIRGLRRKGQRHDGSYEVSKSKTVPVPVARLFAAFDSADARDKWLPDVALTVRTAQPGKSIRMTWEQDGTSVEAYFTAKGDAKSQVSVQHRKLPSREAADAYREYWTERLAALAKTFE